MKYSLLLSSLVLFAPVSRADPPPDTSAAPGPAAPSDAPGGDSSVVDQRKVAEAFHQLRDRVMAGDDPRAAAAAAMQSLTPDEKEAFQKGLHDAQQAAQAAKAAKKSDSAADAPPGPGKADAAQSAKAEVGNNILAGVNDYQKATHPRDPNVFAGSGGDNFRMGRFQQSYDDYDRAIALGSKDPQTYLGGGEAAYRLGDFAAASRLAQATLASDPQNQEALFLYNSAKNRPPTVRLPSSLGELGASRPTDSLLPTGGNGISFQGTVPPPPSGMTVEQVAAQARQMAAPGSDAVVRSAQITKDVAAAMSMHDPDYERAYTLATNAVNLNPQNVQALNFRAMALSHMRRYSDAVQDASAALGVAPGNAAVLATRSWALSKQGLYKDGLQDAAAAIAAAPRNGSLYVDKALAQAGLGDRSGAIESLRQAAALDPRFQTRLEQALQLPQDSDMTLIFDAAPAAAPAPAGSRERRFLRMTVLSAVGGLLIALGVLHVVSAGWREKLSQTVRRVMGPSPAAVADAGAPADSPSAGTFWTQYQLVKEIGFGGMGVVYEATDRSLERRVAVKKMRDEIRLEPQDRRRFVNEARLVAQLHHPNIVDIYGIVEDGMDVYLVFEYVEGRTLQDVLKSDGALDLPRARDVMKGMADAVEHAHGRSVIHRDLKPSNVMLTPEGRVKVMDFGVARQAKDALTRQSMTNTIVGTPPYMAPEQEQGTVRKESDVYALGVCLYEMTTGFLPFAGSGAGMLLNKLNGKLIPATQRTPSLPAGFDAVIAKALSPDPDKRYRTPAELVAALDGLLTAAKA